MPYKKILDLDRVRPLTKGQLEYVARRAKGEGQRKHRLEKLPQIQTAIKEIQTTTQALVCYDLSKAIRCCEKAVDFAYAEKQPMAVVKGTELICKLAGLLIEKHEVITFSIKDALDLAKQRAQKASRQTIEINPESTT